MSFIKILVSAVLAAAFIISQVNAESHTIIFENMCGFGTPILRAQDGQILSTGEPFTINGPLIDAIAYLQTGGCGDSGEGCTVIEITLQNPTSPGSGSSADISVIPPHNFSVTSGFGYFNGCDGAGADCNMAFCPTAFHTPFDGQVVTCQTNDVNLAITFCD